MLYDVCCYFLCFVSVKNFALKDVLLLLSRYLQVSGNEFRLVDERIRISIKGSFLFESIIHSSDLASIIIFRYGFW